MSCHLLHYELISQFKHQFFKNLLLVDHLKPGQIKIDKLSYQSGETDDSANFWGYELEKDGIKYLYSSKTSDGREINIRDILPLEVKTTIKVASKGIVYYFIAKAVSVKIAPQKTEPFKSVVDKLSSFSHSNSIQQKLFWFIILTQFLDRANFRVSTTPGFGKDSTIEILNSLFGTCAVVENPTLAKLEYLASNKLLTVNEVVDVSPENWRNIEQFLLSVGAFKPVVTKHSRASLGTKELLDISKLSLTLMYNDIDCYKDIDKYFDNVAKAAIKDRFPAFRFYGVLKEDFNQIKDLNIENFISENKQYYELLMRNLVHYKEELKGHKHRYIRMKDFIVLPERWKTNIHRLLNLVDLYCDTQEEFNFWQKEILKGIEDYKEMVKYPQLLSIAKNQEPSKLKEATKDKNTFIEKNKVIINMIEGKSNEVQKDFWVI